MPLIMLITGSAMILGSVVFTWYFFANPGKRLPGATAFESADFPNIAGLILGFTLFSFGLFLFVLGLGWVLTGPAGY